MTLQRQPSIQFTVGPLLGQRSARHSHSVLKSALRLTSWHRLVAFARLCCRGEIRRGLRQGTNPSVCTEPEQQRRERDGEECQRTRLRHGCEQISMRRPERAITFRYNLALIIDRGRVREREAEGGIDERIQVHHVAIRVEESMFDTRECP